MTNFIPIFPLGIIVYPGNTLNLHIFEPRYKQLITDCYGENKPFGIPTVLEEQVREFGTLVRITAIKEVYEDGRMDISTEGLTVFRILQTMPEVPDKLYAGAIVNYPPNEEGLLQNSIQPVLKGIRDLHRLLRIDKPL
ncbi:MAG TPA: LON peptidase substrate-binding domain-containing protein, partial [Phnomibacter sp.]|nr:LON peptidase substrate-binding domain-containing protein [Phnomibacter sp.]